jgi:hypothetical protein
MCKGEDCFDYKSGKFCLYTIIFMSNDRYFQCGVGGEVYG